MMEGLVSTMLGEEKRSVHFFSRSLAVNVNADAMKQEFAPREEIRPSQMFVVNFPARLFGLWLALFSAGSKWGTGYDYICNVYDLENIIPPIWLAQIRFYRWWDHL